MRHSKVHNMKHTHLFRCEDQRSQNRKNIVQDRLEGNSFVRREVPLQRFYNVGHCTHASDDLSGLSKGKKNSAGMNIMDYDMPELAIFIQEDHWIDKKVSPERKCLSEHCESDHNIISGRDLDMNSNNDSNLGTMKAMSFNSNVSDCASQHPSVKDTIMELDSGDKISAYHPTKERTMVTLREAFQKETERSFNNLQTNSYLGTIDSRVEFQCPNCLQLPDARSMSRPEMGNSQSLTGPSKRQVDYPNCLQLPDARSMSRPEIGNSQSLTGPSKRQVDCPNCLQLPDARSMSRPEMGNSQSLTGPSKRQVDYPQETSSYALGSLSGPTSCNGPAKTSTRASHESIDSISSSTRSFSFPKLQVEWIGSPERMLKAEKSQSRKHHWWKLRLPCWCK